MNSSSFTIKKSVLLNTLKELTKVLNKVSKYKFTVLEMTVTDGKLTLVIPGAKYILDCETIHSAKGTIDLPYFLDIIKSQKKQSITCTFTDDTIEIMGLFIKIQTTFFETDKILRSIKLPINYSDWHLLKLEKEGFTIEEIEFNKLSYEVNCAKRRLRANIRKTTEVLQIYGISKKEIQEFISKKIDL